MGIRSSAAAMLQAVLAANLFLHVSLAGSIADSLMAVWEQRMC